MANVYVEEYADFRGGVPFGGPVVNQGVIATAVTSQRTSAFGASTNWVRFHTDGIISYTVGVDAVATTTHMRTEANKTVDLAVSPGQSLAVITNS